MVKNRHLEDLPDKILYNIKDFIIKIEDSKQSKVKEIYIGITGKKWHKRASVRPNFFVVCDNGYSENNHGQADWDKDNCACFSRNAFDTILRNLT